jgi:hypothetical protein
MRTDVEFGVLLDSFLICLLLTISLFMSIITQRKTKEGVCYGRKKSEN